MENIQLSNILRIQEASRQNRLVIFIGAGVSTNSGVPMWGKLIDALKKDLPESLKDEKDDLKIAQLYKDSRGHKEYIEKVKESLMYGKVSPNPIHNIILDLKPCHIITTNYDDLIEQAATQKYQQYYVVRKDEDLPYILYQNTLIKMHGDFDTGNIVLTESDYYNYPKNFPLIRAYIQSLFASKLILFIGFSFNDMNLKIILNDVSYILKENMQRVYFLTNKEIDFIQRTYYEKKGINIVSLPSDTLDRYLNEQSINTEAQGLTLSPGIDLYKQLHLIKEFKREPDLIKYLYEYINSCKDEIRVFGEGLKYIIPKNEQGQWNYYSSGLQISSPFIKKIKWQLKTFSGRRNFLVRYNEIFLDIRKQAYLNRVFIIDGIRVVNNVFYRKMYKYFLESSIEYLYNLDYTHLFERIKILRSEDYKCSIEDLELPFVLYKLGDYYQAYLRYKELATIAWRKNKYILYFICMYNIYSIRNGVKSQLSEREDIDFLPIFNEIEGFDLSTILNKLPIDIAIKHIFEDLLSYRSHGVKLVETELLKENISNQRKSAERGGASNNSQVYLLESKFYQEFDFCNENYIICDNNKYTKNLYHNVITGLLNSHATRINKEGFIFQTKIEELRKEHLLLILFHIKNEELIRIIKQYDITQIKLDKSGINYLNLLISNVEKTIVKDQSNVIVNKSHLKNIFQNIISIVNLVENGIINIEEIYPALNYIWETEPFISFSNELYQAVKKCKPNIKNSISLIKNLIFNNFRTNGDNQTVFLLSTVLKENNYTLECIQSIDDIPSKDDFLFLASIFEAVNDNVKHSLISYFMENIKELYYLLLISQNYLIPILDKTLLKKLLLMPSFSKGIYEEKEEVSCSILAKIRKDKNNNSMYEIIDKFAKNSLCFQFYMDPVNFIYTDKIKPSWVCYCAPETIKILLNNDVIKSKVKNYIRNNNFGKLRYEFIWELL